MEWYGADWEGPVGIGTGDDDTVVVDNLPPMLSDDDQQTLRGQIPPFSTLTDEWMISSFTIAKVYVYQHC